MSAHSALGLVVTLALTLRRGVSALRQGSLPPIQSGPREASIFRQ